MCPASAAAELTRSSARAGYAPLDRQVPGGEPLQPGLRYTLAPRLDLTLSHGKGTDRQTPRSRLLEPSYLPTRPSGGIKVKLMLKW